MEPSSDTRKDDTEQYLTTADGEASPERNIVQRNIRGWTTKRRENDSQSQGEGGVGWRRGEGGGGVDCLVKVGEGARSNQPDKRGPAVEERQSTLARDITNQWRYCCGRLQWTKGGFS